MNAPQLHPKVTPLRVLERKLLEFRGVDKRFHVNGEWHTAVEGVDLEIAQGELVTLVGPSGCGKSTLLNMTAGMFGPSTGRVLYRGEELTGLNHRVGYMTQQDHLLPWRTVFDNIALPLEIRGLSKADREQRTHELVHLVGLEGFERHYPSQVSGGMRKRTALARLLAYDPETLLMDEPFGALDEITRDRLNDELLKLWRRTGTTILFVTHSIMEAAYLGQRVMVLAANPGRLHAVHDMEALKSGGDLRREDPRLVETMASLRRELEKC
jgi:NitT/TauT family transport system ATP-binding protein